MSKINRTVLFGKLNPTLYKSIKGATVAPNCNGHWSATAHDTSAQVLATC